MDHDPRSKYHRANERNLIDEGLKQKRRRKPRRIKSDNQWSRYRQKSYSDTHSTVYGHVKSKASRMNEGKRGMVGDVTGGLHGPTRGWNSHTIAYTCIRIYRRQADKLGMLRRTYYGARQYLNTLDGKVVHEGEIGIPLCSGVRRVLARGAEWTEKTMHEQEKRNVCVRKRRRENGEKGRFAHAARAASTKGWNRLEAIHSFGCPVFFPRVWLREHRRPPSCRFSSPPLLTLSVAFSSPTGTLNYYSFPFLSFFLSLCPFSLTL